MNELSRNENPGTLEAGKFPRFYEAIRAAHAHGMIVLSAEGQITSITPEAARLLDLPAIAAPGLPASSLPAPILELISRLNASGNPILNCAVRLPSSQSPRATLNASAFPLPCCGQRGAILIIEDLEAVRSLEHHLQRLDRLADIGTLAASMAHEIKNALVAGRTFIDLLLEKNCEMELAGVVKREIGRIDAIVSRMLKYAGDHNREFMPLRVHEVLEHSLRLAQPQLDGKKIGLERSFLAAADLVDGNENELEQAVMNLVLNALEAMAPGGVLAISTSLDNDSEPAMTGGQPPAPRIQIRIRDTGPGIDSDKLDRVFTPFFTTKPEGTGLGLAITQRIVQEHAGTIRVESELNRGTQFCITLPLFDGSGLTG